MLFSLHTIGLGYPGVTWSDCISSKQSFSSPKTSSRKPYTNSKQQERQNTVLKNTINFSARVYPRGGAPETKDGRPTPDGAGGRGAAERPPVHPPPLLPRLEGRRSADPPPPWSRGDAPPPLEGTTTGGGTQLDPHTTCPSTPSRLLPRGSRPMGEPATARRCGARTTPGGGTRQRTRTVWGPRPP